MCTVLNKWTLENSPKAFIHFFFHFQISTKEAIWISFGVLALSILISTPFIVISELKIMFLKPGAYDHIAFCAEDLSQWGQVCTLANSGFFLDF